MAGKDAVAAWQRFLKENQNVIREDEIDVSARSFAAGWDAAYNNEIALRLSRG